MQPFAASFPHLSHSLSVFSPCFVLKSHDLQLGHYSEAGLCMRTSHTWAFKCAQLAPSAIATWSIVKFEGFDQPGHLKTLPPSLPEHSPWAGCLDVHDAKPHDMFESDIVWSQHTLKGFATHLDNNGGGRSPRKPCFAFKQSGSAALRTCRQSEKPRLPLVVTTTRQASNRSTFRR